MFCQRLHNLLQQDMANLQYSSSTNSTSVEAALPQKKQQSFLKEQIKTPLQ